MPVDARRWRRCDVPVSYRDIYIDILKGKVPCCEREFYIELIDVHTWFGTNRRENSIHHKQEQYIRNTEGRAEARTL